MSELVDIAILGGGSSGLNLAKELSIHPRRAPSTLVLEPKTPQERDCSWALWTKETPNKNYGAAIKGCWPAWQLIDHSGSVTHGDCHYNYVSLSAGKFLAHCESQLEDPVSLRRERVQQIQTVDEGALVTTDQSTIRAKYVYDSRPIKQAKNGLKQHFLGWEIVTKESVPNPHIATLMDFRTNQSRGVHFIYVLPFTPRHLLVESTLVSTELQDKSWYREAIQTWLKDRNIEISQHMGEEYGVIPLENPMPNNRSIGTASGAIRRSSGYGFTAIQQQTKLLAEGIMRGDYRVPKPIHKGLNKMDSIFNGVLLNYPSLSTDIFMRTAQTLSGDQFAQFMLGRADAYSWAKVIAAMPKLPFLKQTLFSKSKQVPLE